jgi:hypothetical protein
MIFVAALRRQARVCTRLSEECDDRHLAERFEMMALDLIAKADEFEQLSANSVYTKPEGRAPITFRRSQGVHFWSQ